MRKLLFVTVVGALLMSAGVCWSGIPHLIHYQGMLTDDEGTPLNTPQDITFRIYNDLTDGTLKWSETQYGIMVTDGLFNVNLGDSTPMDLAFDEDYWLEMDVGPGEILTPRVQLTSVGYAYRAERTDTASYALAGGEGDKDWIFHITDTADTTLMTGGQWGIARAGAVLYGNTDYTHVNLGVACTTSFIYATVGGGLENTASADGATVSGGGSNKATNESAAVGGGEHNTASGGNATVGGGEQNDATGDHTTVGGGYGNSASGSASTVGGGWNNTASGDGAATVAGGVGNAASGYRASVGGGEYNTASGDRATVGGGNYNTASSFGSTVPGGKYNSAAATFSLAAGYSAKANHSGTFVWADSTEADFASTNKNQFLIRASGGVGIGTNNPGGFMLAVNGTAAKTGGGSWSVFSDIRLKEIKAPYDYGLLQILKLDPVRYEYKEGNELDLPSGGEYVGLVAQDVQKVIPEAVEENDEGYLLLKSDPIIWAMLNAIKELKAENEELKKRIEVLESKE
jgi:hypothetical protein